MQRSHDASLNRPGSRARFSCNWIGARQAEYITNEGAGPRFKIDVTSAIRAHETELLKPFSRVEAPEPWQEGFGAFNEGARDFRVS